MKLNFSNYVQTFTLTGHNEEYLSTRNDQDSLKSQNWKFRT